MTVTLCENSVVAAYEPSDDLRTAVDEMARAKAKAEKIVEVATSRLHQAIADEVAKPTRPADVARFMNWHPGYVRKIARERGVAPHVDVEPPRRKAPAPDDTAAD